MTQQKYLDDEINLVVKNMVENIEYELTPKFLGMVNKSRYDCKLRPFDSSNITLKRRDSLLYINEFPVDAHLTTAAVVTTALRGAASGYWAALALQTGEIQKRERKEQCEGKIVEIEGIKYKLTKV